MQTAHYGDTFTSALDRFLDWISASGKISPTEGFELACRIFESDHFGAEFCCLESDEEYPPSMHYLNVGETYENTLIYDVDKNEIYVGSWGSWYEEVEQQHESENQVIRCCYCGKFTPKDPDNYRETVCEHCDHKYS